jgi:hypothetical protein
MKGYADGALEIGCGVSRGVVVRALAGENITEAHKQAIEGYIHAKSAG